MIELGRKTFMPNPTLDLHKVICFSYNISHFPKLADCHKKVSFLKKTEQKGRV